MKQTKLFKTCTLVLATALTMGFAMTGCAEKDLYDPNYGKQELPAPETLPDFSNWSAINLSVDYEMPGYKVLVEVYTENPYEETADGGVVKTTSLPQFAAFTDDDSRFVGKMELPAGTKKVYLCTPAMGLPSCLQLDVTDGNVVFKLADLRKEEVQSRATSPSGKVPYLIKKPLYSLCQWNRYGEPNPNSYITDKEELKTLADMLERTKAALWKGGKTKPSGLDNSGLLRSEKVTNITILKNAVDDNGATVEVKNAKIKLTFLNEGAFWQNTLGYYYYKTGETLDVNTLKKYIIYPNVSLGGHHPFLLGKRDEENNQYYKSSNAPLQSGSQVMLKFFGEDGTDTPTEDFPSGYTIGWFVLADAFRPFGTSGRGNLDTNADCLYSNVTLNSDGKSRCITLTDEKAKKVIVGFEDGPDKSYEDVLFYVDANPSFAIFDPERPVTPDSKPDEPEEEKKEGTLLFEDNWPMQGDYDMNDVAVTYKRVITFNSENKVTKIVDTFVPVQLDDAATKHSAFAFQVDPGQKGAYASLPEGAIFEPETNSFVLFADARMVIGKEFVLTRTFDGTAAFGKGDLKAYNPFIIIDYIAGNTERAEVHLPKMKGTSYADPSLVGREADAYYIDRDGRHPFAIDIPTMNFVLVTEHKKIGTDNEYPRFTNWVENGCKTDSEYANWYKTKK